MSDKADIERDVHLRQALRHAPDAEAAAPAALREMILREAQAKAREGRRAAPAAPPSLPLRLWQWIGSPRFAGALAGVAVIGFAGLLWRERPLEEALPPRAAVQAPAAPAALPPSNDVEKKKEAEGSIAGAAAPAPAPAAEPAPAAAPPPAPLARSEKPKLAAPAPRQVEEAPRRDAVADSRGTVAEESTLQMPRPTPPAPAPVAPAAPPPPAAVAGALSQRSLNESRERSSATADRRSQAAAKAAAPASLAVVPEAAAPAGLQASFAAGPAIAQLRQQISGEATHWYWQRPGGPQHPFDNAISQWLGRLESASRGRWQSIGNVRPAPGTELQLLRDGEVTQRLQITDDAVLWERRDQGDTLRASLDAPTLAALRQALETATP
jgi:hypothetical protein